MVARRIGQRKKLAFCKCQNKQQSRTVCGLVGTCSALAVIKDAVYRRIFTGSSLNLRKFRVVVPTAVPIAPSWVPIFRFSRSGTNEAEPVMIARWNSLSDLARPDDWLQRMKNNRQLSYVRSANMHPRDSCFLRMRWFVRSDRCGRCGGGFILPETRHYVWITWH
jgi:hypothetical protein